MSSISQQIDVISGVEPLWSTGCSDAERAQAVHRVLIVGSSKRFRPQTDWSPSISGLTSRSPSCPSYTWSILMSLDYVPLSTLMVMMIKFGEPDFHEFSHGGPGGIRWLHHVCWLIIPLCSNWTQSILVLRRVFRTRNSTPNVSQKCVWIESHSETT